MTKVEADRWAKSPLMIDAQKLMMGMKEWMQDLDARLGSLEHLIKAEKFNRCTAIDRLREEFRSGSCDNKDLLDEIRNFMRGKIK